MLTPFARCGKIYAYDDRTALACDSVMVTVLWLGVLAAGNIVAGLYVDRLTADQGLALFPIAFIVLDAMRVGALLWLFRRRPLYAPPAPRWGRRGAIRRPVATTGAGLRWVMAALDALILYGAVHNLVLGLPTLGATVLLACAAHLGVYVAQMRVRETVSSHP